MPKNHRRSCVAAVQELLEAFAQTGSDFFSRVAAALCKEAKLDALLGALAPANNLTSDATNASSALASEKDVVMQCRAITAVAAAFPVVLAPGTSGAATHTRLAPALVASLSALLASTKHVWSVRASALRGLKVVLARAWLGGGAGVAEQQRPTVSGAELDLVLAGLQDSMADARYTQVSVLHREQDHRETETNGKQTQLRELSSDSKLAHYPGPPRRDGGAAGAHHAQGQRAAAAAPAEGGLCGGGGGGAGGR